MAERPTQGPGQIAWMVRFFVLSMGGILGVSFILWALTGFSSFGLESDDLAFLVPGAIFTCALAVALMAAMFYSDRSGKDEAAAHQEVEHLDDAGDPK
jgi:hypothetical protein